MRKLIAMAALLGACASVSSTEDLAPVDAAVDFKRAPDLESHKNDGQACNLASQCASGFCVDGVCCDSACNGVCESCLLTGKVGACSAIANGIDPDQECGPPIPTPDGGVGGGDLGLNLPDGGTQLNPNVCRGVCNGLRACSFPSAATPCGRGFCNTPAETANLTCDGLGGCQLQRAACTAFACHDATPATCPGTCTAHSDCQPGFYCNGSSNCVGQKAIGLACTLDAECGSGFCVGTPPGPTVCCNDLCAAPSSCTQTGSMGQCKCPGVTCGGGVACRLFYRDADGDGFGDKFGSVGSGTAVAGCEGSPPSGYVADQSDCDDGDANAKPGQTAFFTTPSLGRGTYDYDCNGTTSKQYAEYPGAACTFCGAPSSCPAQSTCLTSGTQAVLSCASGSFLCGFFPVIRFCPCCGCAGLFSTLNQGFTATIGCGTGGSYTTCGTCASASAAVSGTVFESRTQGCR